jgi:hypothetical protein
MYSMELILILKNWFYRPRKRRVKLYWWFRHGKLKFKPTCRRKEMSKSEFVAAQKAAIIAGQDAAIQSGLDSVWDQAALEQKASDGTLGQPDLDAAVKAATDPLNAQIATLQSQISADAETLKAAQDKAASDLEAVNKALTDMTAKEQLEEQAVADVVAKINQVQASFDAIKSLLAPAAPVAPANPEPVA